MCTDMYIALALYYDGDPSKLKLRGAYVYPASNGMYIDTVSIKSQLPVFYDDVLVETTRRIIPPIQYLNKSLEVTKKAVGTRNTISISFKSRNCVVNLPNFTLVDSYPSNNAQLTKISSASSPVTGTFNLQWNNQDLTSETLFWITFMIERSEYFSIYLCFHIDIPADISEADLTVRLNTLSDFGSFTIERSGSCSGYKWQITWSTGGNKALLQVTKNKHLPKLTFICQHSLYFHTRLLPTRWSVVRQPFELNRLNSVGSPSLQFATTGRQPRMRCPK